MSGLNRYIERSSSRGPELAAKFQLRTDGSSSARYYNNAAFGRGMISTPDSHNILRMGKIDDGALINNRENKVLTNNGENKVLRARVNEPLIQHVDEMISQPKHTYSDDDLEIGDDEGSEHSQPPSHVATSHANDEFTGLISHEDVDFLRGVETGLDASGHASSYPPTTSGRMTEASNEEHFHCETSSTADEVHEPEDIQRQHVPMEEVIVSNSEFDQKQVQCRGEYIQESNQTYRENQNRQRVESSNLTKRKAEQILENSARQLGQMAVIGHPVAQQTLAPAASRKQIASPYLSTQEIHPERIKLPYVQYGSNATSTTVPYVQQHKRIGIPAPYVSTSGYDKVDNNLESNSLDYELDTLYAMTFEELHKEPFDNNQQKGGLLKPIVEELGLSERLAIVAKGNLDEQIQFIASLAAEEWEEAGTWFTEQFSLLVQKSQQSREERRHVAEAYEEEINRRHKAVNKEADHLQTALKEMRRSGDAVLRQGTPKRGQGSTE